ncbi:hypothetical protein [Haloparvum sp. PAK95]|uniref:hypothetical protein n=1 Tax=Haloparvum sp. PAK95 TaxID=3418962 RepID=UPI003D2F303D
MNHRPIRLQIVLAALGLLLLTAPWSLPALAGQVLPRGPYLLFLIPFVGVTGIVYITAASWQYFRHHSEQPPTGPQAVVFVVSAVAVLGAIVAVGWAGEPTVATGEFYVDAWALLLPPLALLLWFPAGEALAGDDLRRGTTLLGIPLAVAGISIAFEGSFDVWLVLVYMLVYAIAGLPVLLLGLVQASSR